MWTILLQHCCIVILPFGSVYLNCDTNFFKGWGGNTQAQSLLHSWKCKLQLKDQFYLNLNSLKCILKTAKYTFNSNFGYLPKKKHSSEDEPHASILFYSLKSVKYIVDNAKYNIYNLQIQLSTWKHTFRRASNTTFRLPAPKHIPLPSFSSSLLFLFCCCLFVVFFFFFYLFFL